MGRLPWGQFESSLLSCPGRSCALHVEMCVCVCVFFVFKHFYLSLSKVMVNLVDFVLPENYFAQNLYALSADMAVFRELLRYYLPELSAHIEELQKGASGAIKKSYSSENPPDQHSIHAYEPPLADVFTMQWFLTIFATSLPRKATRRVWDAILLEGSELLLYTAIAILAVMERYI